MGLSCLDVELLVKTELAGIRDEIVLNALKSILVEPSIRYMDWDYGPEGQTYPCWTVAQDEDHGTALVYCEFGFGPKTPWGLVGISRFNNMGMDSGWFVHLEDVFCESFMAVDLKIWDVVKTDADGERIVIEHSLSTDEAYDLLEVYRAPLSGLKKTIYRVERRHV